MWRCGRYDRSIQFADDYIALMKRLDIELSNDNSVLIDRALALRDSGKCGEALTIFENLDSKEPAIDLGNKARCFIMLKKYIEAEELLKQSLKLLQGEHSYEDRTNRKKHDRP